MLSRDKINESFEKSNYTLLEEFSALNDYELELHGEKIGKYIGEIRIKNDK